MRYDKDEIVEILIKRDEISREEAIDIVNNCQYELNEVFAHGTLEEAEEVIADWLSLEPDYLEAFLII